MVNTQLGNAQPQPHRRTQRSLLNLSLASVASRIYPGLSSGLSSADGPHSPPQSIGKSSPGAGPHPLAAGDPHPPLPTHTLTLGDQHE
jgi:hypothetical protein